MARKIGDMTTNTFKAKLEYTDRRNRWSRMFYRDMARALAENLGVRELPALMAGILAETCDNLADETMLMVGEGQSGAQEAALIALAEAHGLSFVDCVW